MKALLLAALMAAAAGPAAAYTMYSRDTAWEFGLHPGAAIAMGEYRHSALSAFALNGSVGYNVTDWFTAGLEGGYIFGHKLRGTTTDPLYLDLDGDGTTDNIPFQSNVRDYIGFGGAMFKFGPWLSVGAEGKWKPYIIGGCGLYHERMGQGRLLLSGRTSDGTLIPPDTVVTIRGESDSYFGSDGGVGFDIQLDENGGIGAEARYRRFYRHGNDYEAFTPTLRLYYYF